jgi:hypothetical protein
MGRNALDLTFNIDGSERLILGRLKYLACLSSQKPKFGILFLEKILAVIITDKLGSVTVGFEAELLGNESQLHIWLVSSHKS